MLLFRAFSHFSFPIYILLLNFIIGPVISTKTNENNIKTSKTNSYIKKETGFFIGKFTPGHYLEYLELNGFYKPKSAVNICEADFECTGFSYQGAKSVDQSLYIYFFRYIAPPSISLSSVTNEEKVWTSYRVKRSFVVFPLTQENERSSKITKIDDEVSKFSEYVLSGMGVQNDEKRISFGNKIKWSIPNYKAITIDPFTKLFKDNTKSRSTFGISKVYLNEDKLTFSNSDLSRNKSTLLTIIRLNPPIEDAEKKSNSFIKVSTTKPWNPTVFF